MFLECVTKEVSPKVQEAGRKKAVETSHRRAKDLQQERQVYQAINLDLKALYGFVPDLSLSSLQNISLLLEQ